MNLSHASITFDAQHNDAEEGGWHDHEWTWTAYWPSKPFHDGRDVRKRLTEERDRLTIIEDGKRRFPNALWSNEAQALAVNVQKFVIKIAVTREGYGAEAWRG